MNTIPNIGVITARKNMLTRKKATIILQDEVHALVRDLDPETRRILHNKLKFFVPQAKYSPSYKLGRWDGTVSFISIGGNTFINLLDVILPTIYSRGYEINIDDRRKSWKINLSKIDENFLSQYKWGENHPHEGKPIILRDYQVDIINNFLENPQSIQEVATGSGKCLGGETEIPLCTSDKDFLQRFWRNKINVEEKYDVNCIDSFDDYKINFFVIKYVDLYNYFYNLLNKKNRFELIINEKQSDGTEVEILDVSSFDIKVKVPSGSSYAYQKVLRLVKKRNLSSLLLLFQEEIFSNHGMTKGRIVEIVCSGEHLFLWTKGRLIYAWMLKEGDTVIGIEGKRFKLLKKTQISPRDLYDISIDSPHLYVTEEGIVHHNTIITAALSKKVEESGNGTLVIVPNKQLVTQTEKDYKLINLDTGVLFGERKEKDHKHTIATWQSLSKLFKNKSEDKSWLENIAAIIVDEVHSAKAQELKKILTQYFSFVPFRWGLTGTIPKNNIDKITLISSIGPVISKTSAKKLQEKGVLSDVEIFVIEQKQNKKFSSWQEEVEYLTKDKFRLTWVARRIRTIAETGNTLVLFNYIETGELLLEILDSMGVETYFIHGGTPLEERNGYLGKLNDQDNVVILATTGVASVGINIIRLFNLVLFEPGKSFIRTIQSIGRGLRKGKDKEKLHVYDIVSSTRYSKRHSGERLSYYKENMWNVNVIIQE